MKIATHGTAAHVETVVRCYRRAKADLELGQANNRHEGRKLNWYFDDDGMVVVKARLTPEDGAHFISAIESAAKALRSEQDDGGDETRRCPINPMRCCVPMHCCTR